MDQSKSESLYYNFNLELHSVVEKPGNSTVYSCSICSCSYKYEYSLKRHVLRSHVNRAYVTSSDRVTFGVIVEGHHRRTESDQIYSCNACHRLYADRSELVDHVKAMHYVSIVQTDTKDVLIITCPSCKAEFCSMRSLSCHMRSHKSASWNSNGKDSISPTKPSQSALEADTTTAQNNSIPSTNRTLHHNSNQSLLPSPSFSKTRRKKKQLSMTTANGTSETLKEAVTDGEPAGTCSDDMPGHSEDECQSSSKKRQLRQRTSTQRSSLFSCTICHRTFHSYGNMLRHRKLSHESLLKKGPELSYAKNKRTTRKRTRFCDPKVARRYFNKVAADIAFNMKNCVHGNSEHVGSSQHYIQSECKTNLTQLRSAGISKRLQQQCNIKIKPVKGVWKGTAPKPSGSTAFTRPSEASDQTQKQFSLDSTSPDVYDRPGLWKFLCLVCMQYFPNTLELFVHQDSTHKRVNTTYMEVGKNSDLPLHAVATSRPVGCLPVTDGHSIVCNPAKYTCTKCQQQFKSRDDLHPHLIVCGKELLEPLTVQIPSETVHPSSPANKDYGKVKGNKKGRWQRRGDADDKAQQKITDMNGFNVRKKKRSRLESEAEEQKRLEEKMTLIDDLSAKSFQPSLEPLVTLKDITEYNTPYHEPRMHKLRAIANVKPASPYTESACPYCSIPFKYKKVLQRHIAKCEMMKRIISPAKQAESDLDTDIEKEASAVTTTKPMSNQNLVQVRALAKFIHPARTCGPCFACKKPNMARRYIHLQQRSDSFVQFVTSKCKNVSLQSCICKACELRFNRDYANRKSRLEKYSTNRKSPSQTRSLARKSPLSSRPVPVRKLSNLSSQHNQKKKPSTISARQKVDIGILNSKLKSDGQASRFKRKAKPKDTDREVRTGNAKTRNAMSSVRRKQFKPVQTKSLEQIFPEDFDTDEEMVEVSRTPASAKLPVTRSLPASGTEFFNPNDVDIIDVEKEIKIHKSEPKQSIKGWHIGTSRQRAMEVVSKLLGGEGLFDGSTGTERKLAKEDPRLSVKEDVNSGIDLPKDGRVLEPINTGEASDARLKVIMQFVKDSPIHTRSKVGRKSSLTDIIDAVTQKVKEDPSLAATLTDAINAAAAGLSRTDLIRSTRLTAAREAAAVRQSVSLPSVLDGLVVKYKSIPEFSEFKICSPNSSKKDADQSGLQPAAVPSATVGEDPASKPKGHQIQSSSALPQAIPPPPPVSQPSSMDVSTVLPPQVLLCPPSSSMLMNPFRPIKAAAIKPSAPASSFPTAQDLKFSHNWSKIDGNMQVAAQLAHVDRSVPMMASPSSSSRSKKRRRSVSSSNGSLGSSCMPKRKFVMTESSHKHMVEIIDAVARGEITCTPRFSLEDDRHSMVSETDSERSRQIYDFMMESRDNLECIRTADQMLRRGASPQPTKNLRLASIISKLSVNSQKVDCTPVLPSDSPTSSQNPNSIDSGFTSLVG